MSFDLHVVTDAVREHPAIVIGGGVVLFLLIRMGGGGSASSAAAPGQADPNAQLSATTQLQMATIQGGNALQATAIGAQVQMASINAEKTTQLATIAGARDSAELGYAAQLAALGAQTTVAIQTLQSGEHVALLNAQTQQLATSQMAAVQIAQIQEQGDAINIMTQGQVNMAWINGDVSKTGIMANRDIAITQSNNLVEIADINAGASMMGSGMGMIGSIVGGMMSDANAKMDLTPLGMQPNGLMLYEYEYKPEHAIIWGGGRKCGYLAQDVKALYPEAVSITDGFFHVDYSKVP